MFHTGMRYLLLVASFSVGFQTAAEAQSGVRKIMIPFAFDVNGRVMPPGGYVLRAVTPTGTMRLTCTQCKASAFSVWTRSEEGQNSRKVELTFVRMGNDYYLKSGRAPGWAGDWSQSITALATQVSARSVEAVMVSAVP